jgi:amidase
VARLRAAGAIVLAKTMLPDFATSWFALSSMSGPSKNPYALDRDPGASSAGNGVAVAANLAAVGLGEDTGGSIRLPSSFNNLVGLKVTPGLISRTGSSPIVILQDAPGPMARTVTDCAVMMDVLAGYDPADPYTTTHRVARLSGRYVDHLDAQGLQGARLGVVRQLLGRDDDPDAAPVNLVVEQALQALRDAGATLVEVAIPDLDEWIMSTLLIHAHGRHDLDAFLAARPELPVRSVEEIVASKQYHPRLEMLEAMAAGPQQPRDHPGYFEKRVAREELQRLILNIMASEDLAALCYPTVQVGPPTRAELDAGKWPELAFPTNTLIAAHAGIPAITVPAGFTGEGLPVGLEVVGMPYDEPTLLRLGYAFEQATQHRCPPASAPALTTGEATIVGR